MAFLEEQRIDCPYCGESIDILLDNSIADQQYIEDCQVCCRPITFVVHFDEEDNVSIRVFHEDEC